MSTEKHLLRSVNCDSAYDGKPTLTIREAQMQWLQSNPPRFFVPLFSELPQYNDAYIRQIFSGPGNVIRNGALYNDDYENEYVHIVNGRRRTTDQPVAFSRTVHMVGPSWLYGFGAEDAHTIPSYLQRMLNEGFPDTFRVENLGVKGRNFWNFIRQIRNSKLQKDDVLFAFFSAGMISSRQAKSVPGIITALNETCRKRGTRFCAVFAPRLHAITNSSYNERLLLEHSYNDLLDDDLHEPAPVVPSKYTVPPQVSFCQRRQIPCIDLQHSFNRPHEMGEVFFDRAHWNYKGHEACAAAMFDMMFKQEESVNRKDSERYSFRTLVQLVQKRYNTREIRGYLQRTKNNHFDKYEKIGAIVMNANPFTNGHKYLVRKALQKVDALYLFVVENDQSAFSFEDRLRLVQEGTRDFGDRVHVAPSGNFIISSFTFPEYFTKEIRPVAADSSLDILIFGSIIAPALRITTRFVGEEPNCPVTLSYNNTMQEYLPGMRIALKVIPRTRVKDQVISASHVRELLSEGQVHRLRSYVPKSTYAFLCAREGVPMDVFPSGFQRLLLFCFAAPMVNLFAGKKLRAQFKRDPEAFFANPSGSLRKVLCKFLSLFGPTPMQ